jgi:hypothetical protein
MAKVFIIHGWNGYPEEAWFPWLKKELTKKGFKVFVPQMPKASEPQINKWVPFLKKLVKNPDEETYFVGHSIGCQAILRYLEKLPKNKKIAKAIFVSGFVNLNIKSEKDKKIAKPWLKTKIKWNKINKHKSIAIFSDNDPYVPLSDSKIFKNKMKSKIVILHKKGHIGGDDNIKKLPIILKFFK